MELLQFARGLFEQPGSGVLNIVKEELDSHQVESSMHPEMTNSEE